MCLYIFSMVHAENVYLALDLINMHIYYLKHLYTEYLKKS
jgi:hypothetical protein